MSDVHALWGKAIRLCMRYPWMATASKTSHGQLVWSHIVSKPPEGHQHPAFQDFLHSHLPVESEAPAQLAGES